MPVDWDNDPFGKEIDEIALELGLKPRESSLVDAYDLYEYSNSEDSQTQYLRMLVEQLPPVSSRELKRYIYEPVRGFVWTSYGTKLYETGNTLSGEINTEAEKQKVLLRFREDL